MAPDRTKQIEYLVKIHNFESEWFEDMDDEAVERLCSKLVESRTDRAEAICERTEVFEQTDLELLDPSVLDGIEELLPPETTERGVH